MFKIGDFSKLTFVSVRMLRYYDEMGLFKPWFVDDFTGYRFYSASQIKKLNLIVSLRDFGFNVSEISLVLNESSDEKQKEMLVKKQSEIEQTILSQQKILEKINSTIKNLDKERVNMSYNVKLKSVPSYSVISLREVIPTYADEGRLWEKLCAFMEQKELSGGKLCFATYLDDGYKESDVDVEIVMEVSKKLKDEDGFVFKETETLEQVASILVPGDFSNISPAFSFLAGWIEENGYSVCGHSRELPIRGPWSDNNPDDYLNEIQIPVTK